MRDRWDGVESPGAYLDDGVSCGHFCLAWCSFGPPSRALVDYYLERGAMPLDDAVGANWIKGAATEGQGAGA